MSYKVGPVPSGFSSAKLYFGNGEEGYNKPYPVDVEPERDGDYLVYSGVKVNFKNFQKKNFFKKYLKNKLKISKIEISKNFQKKKK